MATADRAVVVFVKEFYLGTLGRGTSKKIHLISKNLDTLNPTATVYFPNHLIFE